MGGCLSITPNKKGGSLFSITIVVYVSIGGARAETFKWGNWSAPRDGVESGDKEDIKRHCARCGQDIALGSRGS